MCDRWLRETTEFHAADALYLSASQCRRGRNTQGRSSQYLGCLVLVCVPFVRGRPAWVGVPNAHHILFLFCSFLPFPSYAPPPPFCHQALSLSVISLLPPTNDPFRQDLTWGRGWKGGGRVVWLLVGVRSPEVVVSFSFSHFPHPPSP